MMVRCISGRTCKLDADYEIPREELVRLIRRDRKLEALEHAGVDNWEGYDYAMEIFREMEDAEV